MKGSPTTLLPGVYNGVGNVGYPGGRMRSASTFDSTGIYYLFGGEGYYAPGVYGYLNDLWSYQSEFTLLFSGNSTNQRGSYGTKGVAGGYPGSRIYARMWVDSKGIWIFGGLGYSNMNSPVNLGDLWVFRNSEWTWVSGEQSSQFGVYGIAGVPNNTNLIGGRLSFGFYYQEATSTAWFFGGSGLGASASGSLSDLWKWDGTFWTWMYGKNSTSVFGVYGTKGVPSLANYPGSRQDCVMWIIDSNIFVFGGTGNTDSASGFLNDLWIFNGTHWTWISGSKTTYSSGTWGTQGVPSSSNIISSRYTPTAFVDTNNTAWIFGGYGAGSGGWGNMLTGEFNLCRCLGRPLEIL